MPPLRIVKAPPSTAQGVPPPPPAADLPADDAKRTEFRVAPTLELRSDLRNPIRTDLSRRIESLGDVWDALQKDFVLRHLRSGREGAQVFIPLGSAFGNPQTPLSQWNPDKKPDVMLLGQSEFILKGLQPLMGWDDATLRANIARAKQGMVYFNSGQETPAGPVRFKIGIMDAELWRNGSHPYFDLRVSLLEAGGPSFVYLSDPASATNPYRAAPSEITAEEFEPWLRRVQADFMRRSVENFLFSSGFSSHYLIARRYHNQFFNYELYRIFDWFKGKEQAQRYAGQVARIVAPAVRDYLTTHPNLLGVHHPDRGTLTPDQITHENFLDLHFSWKQGFLQRVPHWWKSHVEFLKINAQMADQTFRNIASNGTSRAGNNKIGWLQYGLRKFGRFFGVKPELIPREYSPQAVHFPNDEVRLGRVENPLDQMIILSGYGPKNESDPGVFQEDIVEYFEAEISKGLKPNLMLLGNNPSKFTFPIRGVPMIAFGLMEGLRSPVIKHVPIVGVPDVGVVTEAFSKHFAHEIAQKGMTIEFHDVGLEGGSYARNIQRGLDHRSDKNRMTILRPGDTPLVDPHNMAYHPWRHSLDFIIGANGRNMVLDFMGMNPHYTQYDEGVPYDFKEGNGQGVFRHITELVDQIYANRKTVKAGPWKKIWIIGKFAAGKLFRPQTLDTVFLTLPQFAGHSAGNFFRRKLGYPAPKPAWDADSLERATEGHLDWKLNLRSNHLDPGSLIDVDGLRDYLMVEMITQALPPKYLADLQEFSRTTLKTYLPQLSGMTETPARINALFRRVYDAILDREAKRPANERLHIDADRLKRNGVDPGNLPFMETGEFNPDWIKIVLPQQELDRYIRVFKAYFNRGEHAKALKQDFLKRIELRLAWSPSGAGEGDLTAGERRAVEKFTLFEIAKFPQNYQGLILEWDFDRVREALLEKAQKRFGEHSAQVDYFKRYFQQSIEQNYDTPLRRLLMGLKAVEAVRRYQSHLSPKEYRELFPLLEQHIQEATQVLSPNHFPKNKAEGLGNFLIRRYFKIEQENLDRVFVRKAGESPPPYRKRGLGQVFPHSNRFPAVQRDKKGEVRVVETAPWLPTDVDLFSRRLEILPDRIPDLMAQAAGVKSRADLGKISTELLSLERTLQWVQTEQGQAYLKNNRAYLGDHFKNRLLTYGPGLGVGIATLLGAERLADQLGLDPTQNAHERFMWVVGASHLTSRGTQFVLEAGRNALRGNPYYFVTNHSVHAGSAEAIAYRFHAADGLGSGLWNSWMRSYQLSGGVHRMMWNGAKGLVSLPVRAGWHMGPGLMSAAIVDRGLNYVDSLFNWMPWVGDDLGAKAKSFVNDLHTRHWIHFGSFFLPDMARIAMGNKTPRLFCNPLMRGASRAFAGGFIADFAFSAQQRVEYGSAGATQQAMVYQRANALHDADRGAGIVDGALDMIAPQLSAWWDSVEFDGFDPKPNVYQRMAARLPH